MSSELSEFEHDASDIFEVIEHFAADDYVISILRNRQLFQLGMDKPRLRRPGLRPLERSGRQVDRSDIRRDSHKMRGKVAFSTSDLENPPVRHSSEHREHLRKALLFIGRGLEVPRILLVPKLALEFVIGQMAR